MKNNKQGKQDRLFKRLEKVLVEMGWTSQECGRWEDPLTGTHERPTVAYGIARQRYLYWKKRKGI